MEDNDETREEVDVGTALYAYHQTRQYSPPPVIDGHIPKNMYGNLDIYVPSMVPRGGVHIPHPDTSRAARLLGVDYADAVTGFAFRGRHGTAIITGAVVAESCRDAIEEVISAFEIEQQEEEEKGRTLEALRMWKRFLVALRIRERIQGYEIEGERKFTDEATGDGEKSADDDEGGGFIPDSEMTEHSNPVSLGNSEQTHNTYDDDDGGGGFFYRDGMDNEEGTAVGEPGIEDFHKTSRRSNYHDPPGKFVYENFNNSPSVGVSTEARRQKPTYLALEANRLQAPFKQHSQPRQEVGSTAKGPKKSVRSLQTERSSTTRAGPLSQSLLPIDPNVLSSPSKPYLLNAEMAEAMALQQIHDSENLKAPKPPWNHQEANFETSHLTSSSSHHHQSSTSFSPARNASPVPPTQALSPPTQENLEIIDTKSGSPPLRQEEDDGQAESKKWTKDDNESDDAGSLLSRDPSDDEADLSWLDF